MVSLNNYWSDEYIHHTVVDIFSMEAAVQKKVLRELEKVKRNLFSQLANFHGTDLGKRRTNAMFNQVNDSLDLYYSKINEKVHENLKEIPKVETAWIQDILDKSFSPNVFSVGLTDNAVRNIVGQGLTEGLLMRKWWKKQVNDYKYRFESEMRQGMLQNESLGKLVKRVRGIQPGVRRRARSQVRTSWMQVLNDTRADLHKQMGKVIKGYRYVAVLDDRTTPYCRACDGSLLNKNYEVISGNPGTRQPPNHWQCRSILIPYTKSWNELMGKGGGKRSKYKRISKKTRTSMDGNIPQDMNYSDWLKRKDYKFQKDVLGPTRAKWFRDGKIKNLTQLLDSDGNTLTIPEVIKRMKNKTLLKEL